MHLVAEYLLYTLRQTCLRVDLVLRCERLRCVVADQKLEDDDIIALCDEMREQKTRLKAVESIWLSGISRPAAHSTFIARASERARRTLTIRIECR